MWSAEQETDGVIPSRFLRSLHPSFDDLPEVYREIEAAGLWWEKGDEYEFIGWSKRGAEGLGQSTAEQVRTYREGTRRRQQQYRDRLKGATGVDDAGGSSSALRSPDVTHNVASDVTANETENVGSLSLKRSIEGAYVANNVTHNAEPPSRFCAQHPEGSDGKPCGACRDARLARDDWELARKQAPTPIAPRGDLENYCALHPGYVDDRNSPCARCARENENSLDEAVAS
jgi:hypothetical protein